MSTEVDSRAFRCWRKVRIFFKKGFKPEVVVSLILLPIVAYAWASAWTYRENEATKKVLLERLKDEVQYRLAMADAVKDDENAPIDILLQHLNGDISGLYLFPEFSRVRMLGLLQMYQAAGGKFPPDCGGTKRRESITEILLDRKPSDAEYCRAIEHLEAVFGTMN